MQTHAPKVLIAGIAGIALVAVLFRAPEVGNSLMTADAAKATAPIAMGNDVLTAPQARIVPADALDTSPRWTPLTSDEAN